MTSAKMHRNRPLRPAVGAFEQLEWKREIAALMLIYKEGLAWIPADAIEQLHHKFPGCNVKSSNNSRTDN